MAFFAMGLGLFTVVLTGYQTILKKWSLKKIYPLLAICLGILTYVILPVYTKPDDSHHGASAYMVSNLILGTTAEDGMTYAVRRECDDLMKQVVTGEEYDGAKQMLYPNEADYNKIGSWLAKTDKTDLVIATMTKYKGGKLLPYALSGLGISIARVLGLNFGWGALFAALLQMLLFVGCNTYAMRRTPIGDKIFFLFGLLPIVLQQTTSFSYEGALFSGLVIVMALTLTQAGQEKEKWSKKDWIMFILASILLLISKNGLYVPMLLLPLLFHVMDRQDGKEKKRLAVGLLLCLLVIGAGLAWIWLGGGKSVIEDFMEREYYNVYFDAKGHSIAYYLTHPIVMLGRFKNTFIVWGFTYVKGVVGGYVGWLQDIVISPKIVFLYYVLLIAAVFEETASGRSLQRKYRLILWVLAILYAVIPMFVMMVRWTPADILTIEGVQGRYFLPAFLIFFLLLAGIKKKKKLSLPSYVYAVGMALCDVLAFTVCVWLSVLH